VSGGGQDIQDSYRKLRAAYFSKDDRTYNADEVSTVDVESGTFTADSVYPIVSETTLSEGSVALKADGLSVGVSVKDSSAVMQLLTAGAYTLECSLSLRYKTDGGDETTAVIATDTIKMTSAVQTLLEKDTFTLTGEKTLSLTGQLTFSRYEISVSVSAESASHASMPASKIALSVKGGAITQTVSDPYPEAKALVKFLTGPLAGTSVTCTLNAAHTEEGESVLSLPSGTAASEGDTYEITNILTGKVPSSYFTATADGEDTDSLVVNGVVQNRLMLPEEWNGGKNYIDAEDGLSDAEIVEQVVVNDDIYPRFTTTLDDGTIVDGYATTGMKTRQAVVTNNETELKETVTYWAFQDTKITFSKEYILDGEKLQVQFTSGKLNGLTFQADFIADGSLTDGEGNEYGYGEGQWFEIVRSDDYGRYLPDDTLRPEAGDRYILLGWDSSCISSLGLVENAEKELLAWAKEHIKETMTDPSTYTCDMMSDDAYGKNPQTGGADENYAYQSAILLGDRVKLHSDAYFAEGYRISRVIGFERCLDITWDTPQYIIGEKASYSTIQSLSDQVDELTLKGQALTASGSVGGSGLYVIRTNDSTAPTDKNVYSALKSLQTFLRKDADDKASGVITFLKGILFGSGKYGITGDGAATLKSLLSGEIKTDYLTVTKAAHFFKLVVDEMKSASGTVINTAANCVLDKVTPYGADGAIIADDDTATAIDHWRCWWKAEDGDGRAISNQWEADDQAICYTCNLAEGTTYDAANRYWWRLVTGAGSETADIDGTAYSCHYIDVSNTTYDAGELTGLESCAPEAGDNVAQLGNRSDTTRQGAIIYASYATPDKELQSPSFAQYQGITSFDLSSARYTWFAMNGNKIRGDFEVTTEGLASYVHYAYSSTLTPSDKTAPDGEEWSRTAGGKAWKYWGVVSDHTESDEGLGFSDYSWAEVKGSSPAAVELTRENMQLVVDDEGNAVGGLWSEDSSGARQYTLYTAAFARRGGAALAETTEDTCSEGEYRVKAVNAYNCSYTHANGAFYITGITNIRDGVAGTDDDTGFDYDAMRNMTEAWLHITFDIEGEEEIQKVFRVVISHTETPYITADLSNETASVSCYTGTGAVVGELKTTLSMSRGNESLTPTVALPELDGFSFAVSGGEITATLTDKSKSGSFAADIHSSCVYAGVSYERVSVWTLNVLRDTSVYELSPSATAIKAGADGSRSPSTLSCGLTCAGADGVTEMSALPDGFTLAVSIDGGERESLALGAETDVSAAATGVELVLLAGGSVIDRETIPVLSDGEKGADGAKGEDGKDGNGSDTIYYLSADGTAPSTPSGDSPSGWLAYCPEYGGVSVSRSGDFQATSESGYQYESTNTENSTTDTDTLTVRASKAGQTVTVSGKASSEANYDKLIISALDSTSAAVTLSGDGNTGSKTFTLGDTSEHTITITYSKDSSQSKYDDKGYYGWSVSGSAGVVYVSTRKITAGVAGAWSQPVRYSPTDGKDGKDGAAGEDGWTVELSPASIAVETSESSSGSSYTTSATVGSSSTYTYISALHGSKTATVSVSSLTDAVNCSADWSGTKIWLTSIDRAAVPSGSSLSSDDMPFCSAGSVTVNYTASEGGKSKTGSITLLFTCDNSSKFARLTVTQDSISSTVGDLQEVVGEDGSSGLRGSVSKIEQTADSIEQRVDKVVDDSGAIKSASIMTAVNADESEVKISADKISLTGKVSATSLHTSASDGSASIDIFDGLIEISGKTAVNIRFGVDSDGYAVLSYYDNDGKLLYNLGPNGLDKNMIIAQSWTEYTLIDLSSTGITVPSEGDYCTYAQAKVLFNEGYGQEAGNKKYTATLYRYTAARVNKAYTADSSMGFTAEQAEEADGRYFTKKASGYYASGEYATIQTAFMLGQTSIEQTDSGDYTRSIYVFTSGVRTSYEVLCTSDIYNRVNGTSYS